MITADELRALLRYDPETGEFWWRENGSGRKMGLPAGVRKQNRYRQIKIYGCRYYAHRLAWFYVHGVWPLDDIDHINGDRDDNRTINLREATRSQNTRNSVKPSNNTSGFKGVSWTNRDKKWVAQIGVNGRNVRLGSFDCKFEAYAAYVAAAKKYHGEFARFA